MRIKALANASSPEDATSTLNKSSMVPLKAEP
jgi:hypothetical protein